MTAAERETTEQAASAEECHGAESQLNGVTPAASGKCAGPPGGADSNSGVSGAAAEIPSETEYLRMNHRRFDLIHKLNREGLTAEEAAEFERLDAAVGAYVNHHHPLPTLHLREIEELARRLGTAFSPPSQS